MNPQKSKSKKSNKIRTKDKIQKIRLVSIVVVDNEEVVSTFAHFLCPLFVIVSNKLSIFNVFNIFAIIFFIYSKIFPSSTTC